MSVSVNQVKEVLLKTFDLGLEMDEIDESTSIIGDGLGLDSVDALEIIVAVERNFGVKIPSDKLKKDTFSTIGHLTEFINELTGK